MRLIDKDEILKRKADVYDKNGHLLLAVPTGEIWAAKTVDAVPLDKLCEWLGMHVVPPVSDCLLTTEARTVAWKVVLNKFVEEQDAAD